MRGIGNCAEFAGEQHQGEEEQAGIQVVVHGQTPDGIPHHGQCFLGVDGIQSDAERGQNTVNHSNDGQSPWRKNIYA